MKDKPIDVETTVTPLAIPSAVAPDPDPLPVLPPDVDRTTHGLMQQRLINIMEDDKIASYGWEDQLGRVERFTNAQAAQWFSMCTEQKLFPGIRLRVLPIGPKREPSRIITGDNPEAKLITPERKLIV